MKNKKYSDHSTDKISLDILNSPRRYEETFHYSSEKQLERTGVKNFLGL